MSILNGEELKKELAWLPKTNKREFFCGDCYKQLEEINEGVLSCPNKMCLNEEFYPESKDFTEENEAHDTDRMVGD